MIKIAAVLAIILTSSSVLLQETLPAFNVTIEEVATGSLKKDQKQYFYYEVDHERLQGSILSLRIKGGEMFTDPDVYLSLSEQDQFDPNSAQYKCFSWGEDVCSVNGRSVENISRLYGVIMCQFDCEYELSLAVTTMVECDNPQADTTITDPSERNLSTQCMLYFLSGNIGRDQAFLRFHVPDNPNISRVTFLAQNDMYVEGSISKIDMWVQEGDKEPETNCACHRGYSLFERAIGFTLTKDKLKLGSNYTMLLEQFQQQDEAFSTRTIIQMIVELENEIIELKPLDKAIDMTAIKRGIVPRGETNCYKYNVHLADSDLSIMLQTHTGMSRLFVGKGDPVLDNNQYQKDAYFQNQAQPFSYVDIPEDERIDAQTGQQYLCVQGLTWASYSLEVREYPGDQKIRLIGPTKEFEFEVQDVFNMLYVSEASEIDQEIKMRMIPPAYGKLKMYVRECRLHDPAFPINENQGRYYEDLSGYEASCVPSKRDKEQLNNVRTADSIDMRGVETLELVQECAGQLTFIENTYIGLSPCAFLIQVENLDKQTPYKFRMETPTEHFNDTFYLQEHQPESYTLTNQGQAMFFFSVWDQDAKQIEIQIDAIHGAVSLFASKWEKPNITTHDFSSTRCGRVPDVITVNSTKLLAVRPQEQQAERNVLIGDYYVLVRAWADSTFNIVYTVQRGNDTSAGPIFLSLDQPYTGVLKQPGDFALFKFTGGWYRFGGDDIRVSVINLSTSQALKIYVTPYDDDQGIAPEKADDYMFQNSHQNYVLLSHANPDLDLFGSFFVRVEYPPFEEGSTLRFRINVMSGFGQYYLTTGEAHDAYLEPGSADEGMFFQYYPYHYEDQMSVTLTDYSGIPIQMFISVGSTFPSEGDANYGKFSDSALITLDKIKQSSQNCSQILDSFNDTLSFAYIPECSIHIGVFLKRSQGSIKSPVHFAIKITERFNQTLQLLVDGRTEYGMLFESVDQREMANYYYRLPAMPQDAVFITLTTFFNEVRIQVQANIVALDGGLRMDELAQHLPVNHPNEPQFFSSDYFNSEHIRISEHSLNQHNCAEKLCYIVMSVVFADPAVNGTVGYDILISSQTSILIDQEIIYDNVKEGSAMYYEYHNLCADCTVSFFLNLLSPATGDVDLLVNYSEQQVNLGLPSFGDSQFYSAQNMSDILVISPEKKMNATGLSENMEGYYLVAVYGSYGDNLHYSLRVSTMTEEVKVVTEGIAERVKNAPQNSVNYFIWKNWGSAHINVYVNTNIGDVEIWMNSVETDILGQAYNYLPDDAYLSHWSSKKEKTRNKLEINLYDHNDQDHFCAVCYYLIAIKNQITTSYDVTVTTVSKNDNSTEEGTIQMYLPFSKVTQGHCSPKLIEIWQITIDANHPDDIELRVGQTVGHNTLYVDVGFKPLGQDIVNDLSTGYIVLEGEDLTKELLGLKNLYFSVYCIKSVSYTIEVRSIDPDDKKITPTMLQKNTPISGSFSSKTKRLFYSLPYTNQAVFVNLSKSPVCDVSIYADFQTATNRPLIPNQGSPYKHEEMNKGNFLTIVIPKEESVPRGSTLIFGIYLNSTSIPYDYPENEEICDFTISTDSIEVQTIQENVFYLGRMSPLQNIKQATLRSYMNIFEIKNPRSGKQQMRVELKPCSNTFIEFCVASEYSTGDLNIKNCVGKSEALSGGKKQAEFQVVEPLYYIYVYRSKEAHLDECSFFIRAFFQYSYSHIFTLAENDGLVTLVTKISDQETSTALQLNWGVLNKDNGPGQIEKMTNVNYTVFKAPYANSLRTECDLDLDNVEVLATVTDQYSLVIDQLTQKDADGITLNVYAEPIEYFSEGVLYEPIKYGGGKRSSAFFWILLCLVFGFFAFLGICLACIFRKNLKKKQKELEFEMTDVRNVARVNQPAAPYYEVYEEDSTQQAGFSANFQGQKDD